MTTEHELSVEADCALCNRPRSHVYHLPEHDGQRCVMQREHEHHEYARLRPPSKGAFPPKCTSCNGSGVRFPTNSRPLPPGTDRSCERCRGTKVEPATEGTP